MPEIFELTLIRQRNQRSSRKMAWSTREIAELAGVTVKAVRHYHGVGLLELPHRSSNNYKLYDVGHVARLLHITRYTELGVPLSQIASMAETDAEPSPTLRDLDKELAASIKKLELVRAELALIFRQQSSPDMPRGFLPISSGLSVADKTMILIYSRLYGPAEMEDVRDFVNEISKDPAHFLLDSLPADAAEDVRQSLAVQYAPVFRTVTERYPWMLNPGSRAKRGQAFGESTITQAFGDLYNAAQLDVLERVTSTVRAESGLLYE